MFKKVKWIDLSGWFTATLYSVNSTCIYCRIILGYLYLYIHVVYVIVSWTTFESTMPSRKSEVLEIPQTTIGAQDLMTIGPCSEAGFLRKQGLRERLFKFLRWRHSFVIVSRGCIYLFKDELAPRPRESYSLKQFLRTCRNEADSVRWSFKVLPVDDRTGKTLVFACISDQERKQWMKSLKAEMIKAHKITEQATNENRDEYVYLEKPLDLPETQETTPKASVQTTEEDPDDPGGEKEYDTIDDVMVTEKPPKQIPAFISSAEKKKPPKQALVAPLQKETAQTKTNVKKKSSTLPVSTAVLRSTFEYHGTDRDEIESLLIQRPEGTYLVRQSRQDGKEVLSVNIEGVLKEFKIYPKNSEVTIDHTDYFGSVEEMIQFYIDHPLPKKSAKLYRAYSVVDPRYIN